MATARSIPIAEESRENDAHELEATELRDYEDAAHSPQTSSTTIAMDADGNGINVEPSSRYKKSIADQIRAFWKRHVVVTVSHKACRDHFGAYLCQQPMTFPKTLDLSSSAHRQFFEDSVPVHYKCTM